MPRPPFGGRGYVAAKRAFDVAFSLLAVAVCFAPGLLLSAAVYADTRAFPIYSQERVGKGGKPFRIHKFRTMVANADEVERFLDKDQLEVWHRERKVENDPRVTKLGRILRETSIDEIPNFLDVLAGNMSIVGPRPITEEELQWFGDDADKLLSVAPGITGWWQTQSRNDSTFKTGVRQSLELYYVDHACCSFDLQILFKSVGAVVRKTGR